MALQPDSYGRRGRNLRALWQGTTLGGLFPPRLVRRDEGWKLGLTAPWDHLQLPRIPHSLAAQCNVKHVVRRCAAAACVPQNQEGVAQDQETASLFATGSGGTQGRDAFWPSGTLCPAGEMHPIFVPHARDTGVTLASILAAGAPERKGNGCGGVHSTAIESRYS